MTRDLGKFLSKYSKKNINKISIVVIPQIQLTPYIISLLLRNHSLSLSPVIVIYPIGNYMSRFYFEIYSNVLGLNVRDFNNDPEEGNRLLNQLDVFGFKIDRIYLHVFSKGYNLTLFRQVLSTSIFVNKLIFYSDGSRNNIDIEWDRKTPNLLMKAIELNLNPHLFSFGFKSNKAEALEDVLDNSDIVEYNWFNAIYKLRPLTVKKKLIDNNGKKMLVLSRYWGREPYEFIDNHKLFDSYSSTLVYANPYKDSKFNIVFRADNRFDKDYNELELRLQNQNISLLNFNDTLEFDGNIPLSELLMEHIMFNIPDYISQFDYIFSFDSSFPLIFQSKELMNQLRDDQILVIGFNYSSVEENSINYCLEVMIERTIMLVADILRIKLFRVFDKIGPISDFMKISKEDLINRLGSNGGYFYLRKY